MEDLAFMDQSAELPSMPMRSWSLDQYDVSVDIISTSVKWAVYGLQMTERMISSSPVAFQPCVGKLFWQRHYEGRVRFLRRDTDPTSSLRARQAGMEDNLLWNCSSNTSLSEAAGGADNLLSTADPDIPPILNNNTISATSPPNTPQLEVVPTYNGLPMTAKDIFTIALSTMVLGAEQGPKTPCLGITGDAFDMVPLFDSHGQSLLKYHSLIRAMRLLTRWMAAMHRFGEVDIQLVRDEVVIGLGRLKRFGADEGGF